MSTKIEILENFIALEILTPSIDVEVIENPCSLELIDEQTILELQDETVNLEIINQNVELSIEDTLIEILEIGIQGPPGSGVDKHYTQTFSNTNSILINHNLNKNPSVTIVDTNGVEIEVDVQHLSLNSVQLDWGPVCSGTVYFN